MNEMMYSYDELIHVEACRTLSSARAGGGVGKFTNSKEES